MFRDVTPSIAQGYARSRGESLAPEQWDGIRAAWHPGLGDTGQKIFDTASHAYDAEPVNFVGSNSQWEIEDGRPSMFYNGAGFSSNSITSLDIGSFEALTVLYWVKVLAGLTSPSGSSTAAFGDLTQINIQPSVPNVLILAGNGGIETRTAGWTTGANWTHVALRFFGGAAGDKVTFLVNGALVSLAGTTTNTTLAATAGTWQINRRGTVAGRGTAWYSDYRLYDTPLSNRMIRTIYEEGEDFYREANRTAEQTASTIAVGNPWYQYAQQVAAQ